MAGRFPQFRYSKNAVTKAGRVLLNSSSTIRAIDRIRAYLIIANWRSSHLYPLNTFQATLRKKLKTVDKSSLVAQRLKRMPSIVGKLRRYPEMNLVRMQDVGGLRAVVSTLRQAKRLEQSYLESKFQHSLVNHKDYIEFPKTSGYRGIHLVYKYKNSANSEYDGFLLEIQIRTKIQHAWATAVETMGVFLNEALKASEGPDEWLEYFVLAGSAFACLENSKVVDVHQNWRRATIFRRFLQKSERLEVKDRLRAFTIAADQIVRNYAQGNVHLLILNTEKKTVQIHTFSQFEQEVANTEYSKVESQIERGKPLMAVLVSAGRVKDLRKAYPNYFLDTREFIKYLERIERSENSLASPPRLKKKRVKN